MGSGHRLALAAVVVTIVFGVPAWLVYFRDGHDRTPAGAAAASSGAGGDVRTVTQVETTTDATPLGVELDRPAEIGFGTGDPPSSATAVSIERGWTS